jgi:hypothetical protein
MGRRLKAPEVKMIHEGMDMVRCERCGICVWPDRLKIHQKRMCHFWTRRWPSTRSANQPEATETTLQPDAGPNAKFVPGGLPGLGKH